MRILFGTNELERLWTEPDAPSAFPVEIAKAYRKRIQIIQAAVDERDLYAIKSNHFEKLQGDRAHQRSLRLNDRWRVVLEIREGNPGKVVHIVSIEDYH